MKKNSKIVVIGGNGLIGTKLVNHLRLQGHDVMAASRSSGVNAVTGEGLADVIAWLNGQRTRGLTASGRPDAAPHGGSVANGS